MENTVALILCAGLGTRMKSSKQKGLHLLGSKPLCVYPVKTALKAGLQRCVVVVGYQGEEVRRVLEENFKEAPLDFVVQSEQRGTAHAVACAFDKVCNFENVIVINGDMPLLRANSLVSLWNAFSVSGGILAILTAVLEDPTGYGRVVRDLEGMPKRIIEEKDATPSERQIKEVNVGVTVARTRHLFKVLERISDNNVKREFYFTDCVRITREDGFPVGTYTLLDNEEAIQVNDRIDLARAEKVLYLRKARELMESGVTIHMPETVMIDEECEVGEDCEIYPEVELRGKTKIGCRTIVGRGCVLTDATVGDDVLIKPYCVASSVVIEDGCQIGPFAHLRAGSVLHRGARIGNFVETKNTVLGAYSKANHLSYLGDCTIGKEVNIGAGTITCNYDGVRKNPTVIEDGAFIGSDTQLVAPVKVGKNAYVGAGTTVTKDVPDGALALSRVQQTHIMGYAERKKQSAEGTNKKV